MDTLACNATEGITFLGKDCHSKDLIQRINRVDAAFCLIQGRIRVAVAELSRYCSITESSSSEDSSSSSSECQLGCAPEKTESLSFMISSGILDDAVYDSLKLLEDEACLTFRELKLLEAEVDNACFPSSSSSEAPSSSSSEEPSSSSSEEPSSSSSSSEEPPLVCRLIDVLLIGYCPLAANTSMNLIAGELFDDLYSPCYFYSFGDIFSSSSSSGEPDPYTYSTKLVYNLALNRWELTYTTIEDFVEISTEILAIFITSNKGDPAGSYTSIFPGCETYPYFVI